MKDISLILRMDLRPQAIEGPGWYVYALGAERQPPLISAVKVAPAAANAIAETVETVLRGFPSPTGITATQLISSGNNLIRLAVQEQLKEAEAQASRIKGLRQALEALGGSSDTLGEPLQRQESESV